MGGEKGEKSNGAVDGMGLVTCWKSGISGNGLPEGRGPEVAIGFEGGPWAATKPVAPISSYFLLSILIPTGRSSQKPFIGSIGLKTHRALLFPHVASISHYPTHVPSNWHRDFKCPWIRTISKALRHVPAIYLFDFLCFTEAMPDRGDGASRRYPQ